MSVENVARFMEAVGADEDIFNQVSGLARAHGFEFSHDDYQQALAQAMGELSDKALDGVTGGGTVYDGGGTTTSPTAPTSPTSPIRRPTSPTSPTSPETPPPTTDPRSGH